MKRRKRYFKKQKLIGLGMIVFSIAFMAVAPLYIFMIPIGIGLMRTKDMVWMDDYYFEVKERLERKQRTH